MGVEHVKVDNLSVDLLNIQDKFLSFQSDFEFYAPKLSGAFFLCVQLQIVVNIIHISSGNERGRRSEKEFTTP